MPCGYCFKFLSIIIINSSFQPLNPRFLQILRQKTFSCWSVINILARGLHPINGDCTTVHYYIAFSSCSSLMKAVTAVAKHLSHRLE